MKTVMTSGATAPLTVVVNWSAAQRKE